MTPGIFWSTSPRKLIALLDVHIEMNNTEESNTKTSKNKEPKFGYIDQIF